MSKSYPVVLEKSMLYATGAGDISRRNIAFLDGQNIYMSTMTDDKPWRIDLARLRVYLRQKYHVGKAYYFLGFAQAEYQELYDEIQEAGFILQFREHSSAMLGKKKGNVDTDIVFAVMKKLYRKEAFDKVVLVSGDGDYKLLVDFLIEEKRFEKILFPDSKRASSLYKKITRRYFDGLDRNGVREKIAKKRGP